MTVPTNVTNFKINRTTVFDPAKNLGKGYRIWRGSAESSGLLGEEVQDSRSLSLTEIDWTKVWFETTNQDKDGEGWFDGEVSLRRLKASRVVLLDLQVCSALYHDYNNNEPSVLRWLQRQKRIHFICFLGTEIRHPSGVRHVMVYKWNEDEDDWENYTIPIRGVAGHDGEAAVLLL